MSKRGPVTFAKRQREMEKKKQNEEKRAKRAERAKEGPREPEITIHKPFVDGEY
jgi:hypothetical protein